MTPSSDHSFLGRLVERSLGSSRPADRLSRRRPGLFEPRAIAPAAVPDSTMIIEAAPATPSAPAPPEVPMMRAAPMPVPAPPAPAAPAPLAATITVAPVTARVETPLPLTATTPARADRVPEQPLAPRVPAPKAIENSAPTAHAHRLPTAAPALALQAPSRRAPAAQPLADASPALPAPGRIVIERTHHDRHVASIERVAPPAMPVPAMPTAPPAAPSRVTAPEAAPVRIAHPSRSAMLAPAPPVVAATPAPVQISIGRVEIRGAGSPAASTAAARAPREPQLGLDEYLRQRHGNAR